MVWLGNSGEAQSGEFGLLEVRESGESLLGQSTFPHSTDELARLWLIPWALAPMVRMAIDATSRMMDGMRLPNSLVRNVSAKLGFPSASVVKRIFLFQCESDGIQRQPNELAGILSSAQ